ncbi:MAG TPA: ferredoxin [Streptosporangiaceae bacterium]|nr:ferredoxin [Streptosporangiaceae bacterium]
MPTLGTASSATGVISLVLLSAVVVLGLLLDRRVRLPGLPRFAGLSLHRYASLITVGFLALHIITAVAGPYARIGLAAIVVPFASAYARSWLALGAVATDVIIAIVATSLLRRHLSFRAWRAVHWLAYACWPFAFAHSIGTGGGMRGGRLLDLAVVCAVAVTAAAGWRVAAAVLDSPAAARQPGKPSGMVRPPLARPGRPGLTTTRLSVDPVACTGHGLCAELLPELVALDRWGYPLLADQQVPASLVRRTRRAVTDCPALALKLTGEARVSQSD